MMRGIAHVSFSGGGMFLPARSPYDRQVLAEHVMSRVRTKGQVQVLIDNQRWMVYQRRGVRGVCCSQCGRAVDSACYLISANGTLYCVTCAFRDLAQPTLAQPVMERRMSS